MTRFQEELRNGMQALAAHPLTNVLAEVVSSIEVNPAFTQSRLLTRLLSALISQNGEFRRAEVFAFDSKTRAMVIALLEAFAAGIPAREEWMRAVDDINTARLASGI